MDDMKRHEYTSDAPFEWFEGGDAKGASKFPVTWSVGT